LLRISVSSTKSNIRTAPQGAVFFLTLMAKQWDADANGLWSWERHPDGKDSFTNNPPKSIDEALKRKTNMYVREDGSVRTLRAKSRAQPYKGFTFEDESYDLRKANRGGTTKRSLNEKLVTPDPQVRAAANRKMAHLSSKGLVGHHGLPVSYLANAERAKPGTMAAYQAVHGKAVGHTPQALVPMRPKQHSYLHNVLEPAYERSIKNAGKESDVVFSRLQNIAKSSPMMARYAASLLGFAPDIIEIADNYSNGAVSNGINNGISTATNYVVDNGKKTVNGVNGIVKQLVDYYADKLPGATNGFNFTD